MKQSFSMSRMTILSLTKFVIQYIYLVFLQNYDRFKLCVFVLWGKLSLPPPSIVERRDDSTTELAHFSRKFSGAQEKLLAPARRERERESERERKIYLGKYLRDFLRTCAAAQKSCPLGFLVCGNQSLRMTVLHLRTS